MKSLFINNLWQNASGEEFSSFSPNNGEMLFEGNFASKSNCNKAVLAAKENSSPAIAPFQRLRGYFAYSVVKLLIRLSEIVLCPRGRGISFAVRSVSLLVRKETPPG